MKFYISSRVKKAHQAKILAEELKKKGHKSTLNWTLFGKLQPYDKNPRRSSLFSKKFLKAIEKCDIFILISDRSGTGMYAEFGYALANNKRIFVVGKHLNNLIFFFHPRVKIVSSIEDLLMNFK